MGYNSFFCLGSDAANTRHGESSSHVTRNESHYVGQVPSNFYRRYTPQGFGGYTPSALNDIGVPHDSQRGHLDSNVADSSGGQIYNSGSFGTRLLTPLVRPTSLPQVPRLPSYPYHIPGTPQNIYMRFGETHAGIPPQNPTEDARRKDLGHMVTGVSVNYLGDPYLKANQSAHIPDELNTSVWITNLPPKTTHKMLLNSIRDCGKVYASVVNGPENDHITSAAKVVFWDVTGAENLLQQAREGTFIVGGFLPRVLRNRIRTESRPPSRNSRVLHIEGPSCIVNQPFLTNLLHANGITWQDEEVLVLSSNDFLTRLEWRFGSYRCQAESARLLIDKMKKRWDLRVLNEHRYHLWQSVTVHFGVDPCAPKQVAQQIPSIQGTLLPEQHSQVQQPSYY